MLAAAIPLLALSSLMTIWSAWQPPWLAWLGTRKPLQFLFMGAAGVLLVAAGVVWWRRKGAN